MLKTFQYRLYPSKKQITILNQTLDECRWLYNHLLEQRKKSWEEKQKSLSCFDQCNSFKILKKKRPSLGKVHSQVLQNVAVRIDLAFKAFFRRVKTGEDPGYPRFKGKFRYDSFTYPQSGFEIIDKSFTKISKIGSIKTIFHRKVEGTIKTCTIKRTRTDKWFVSFSCEIDPKRLPKRVKQIGIDVGLESFATLSDGSKIDNPRFFKREEKNLAKAQRKFDKTKKGTPERIKKRKIVARVHERITNKRKDFIHKLARTFIKKYGMIAIEDLSINDMRKDNFRAINKSIGDVAWNMFFNMLSSKAEGAGRKVVKVNPAYTSQTCSKCGNRQKLKLSDRSFNCLHCGLILDRDHNASLNILTLGMQSLGLVPRSPSL